MQLGWPVCDVLKQNPDLYGDGLTEHITAARLWRSPIRGKVSEVKLKLKLDELGHDVVSTPTLLSLS